MCKVIFLNTVCSELGCVLYNIYPAFASTHPFIRNYSRDFRIWNYSCGLLRIADMCSALIMRCSQ